MWKLVKENPKYFPELPNPWSWKPCSITLSWDEGCRNGALYTLFFHFDFPDGENLALDFSVSCSPKSNCRIGFLLFANCRGEFLFLFPFCQRALDILHLYQPKSVCCFLNVFGVIFFLIKKGICICSLIYRLLQGWIFLGLFCSPPFFCVKSRLGFFPCFFIKFVGVRSALFFFYLFFPPYKANKTILLFFSVPSHQNTAFIIPRICSNLS